MGKAIWTFMEYVRGSGRGEITEWVKDLEDEPEAEFFDILRRLAVTPRDQWTRPEYSPLSEGISEIRFKGNKIQYRPLGFFISADGQEGSKVIHIRQYVLLLGASKKMKVWTPKDAIDTAKRRKKDVLADRSRIRIYDQYSFQSVSEN